MANLDKGTVLLFRAPKDGENDLYEAELKAKGFQPFNVQVLDFNFINLDQLYESLTKNNNYSGILLTSPRAVEACALAFQKVASSEEKRNEFFKLKSYCVGPNTKQQASKIGFIPADCEAGNADKLAKYIIENNSNSIKPLLYPCGNLRRDTLSEKLRTEGFSLEEIVVYETVKSKTVEANVEKLVELHGEPKYIVYFSPSGVQYTTQLFEKGILQKDNTNFIAIGSTTESELRKRSMTVAATANSPSHTGVAEALMQFSAH